MPPGSVIAPPSITVCFLAAPTGCLCALPRLQGPIRWWELFLSSLFRIRSTSRATVRHRNSQCRPRLCPPKRDHSGPSGGGRAWHVSMTHSACSSDHPGEQAKARHAIALVTFPACGWTVFIPQEFHQADERGARHGTQRFGSISPVSGTERKTCRRVPAISNQRSRSTRNCRRQSTLAGKTARERLAPPGNPKPPEWQPAKATRPPVER